MIFVSSFHEFQHQRADQAAKLCPSYYIDNTCQALLHSNAVTQIRFHVQVARMFFKHLSGKGMVSARETHVSKLRDILLVTLDFLGSKKAGIVKILPGMVISFSESMEWEHEKPCPW